MHKKLWLNFGNKSNDGVRACGGDNKAVSCRRITGQTRTRRYRWGGWLQKISCFQTFQRVYKRKNYTVFHFSRHNDIAQTCFFKTCVCINGRAHGLSLSSPPVLNTVYCENSALSKLQQLMQRDDLHVHLSMYETLIVKHLIRDS